MCSLGVVKTIKHAFLRVINTPRRGVGPDSIEKLAQFASARSLSLFDAVFVPELAQCVSANRHKSMRSFCQQIVKWASDAKRGDPISVFESVLESINYELWLQDSGDLEQAIRR